MSSHSSSLNKRKLPVSNILIGFLALQVALFNFTGFVFAQEIPAEPSAEVSEPAAPVVPTAPVTPELPLPVLPVEEEPAPEPEPVAEAGTQAVTEEPAEPETPVVPELPSLPEVPDGSDLNEPETVNNNDLEAPDLTDVPGYEPPVEETAVPADTGDTPTSGSVDATNDGGNEVSGVGVFGGGASDGSSTEIITGDALAIANSVKVLNFNAFESNGVFLLLNNLFGVAGNLDLRNLDNIFANVDYGVESRKCSLFDCSDGSELSTVNKNTAEITNDVIIRAETGTNEVSQATGDAYVESGDAAAIGNFVNVANANFEYANYGVVVYNAVNWEGDVILPTFVQEGYESTGRELPLGTESTDVLNYNKSEITNDTSSTADTGTNVIENTGGTALVESGEANAATSIVTQANQTFINQNSVIIVFRIFGEWSGQVLNTPSGILWEETGDGLAIYTPENDPRTAEDGTAVSYDNFESTETKNINKATITNNIHAFALTGENKLANNAGDAHVASGNAFSAVSIANIANLNVIGGNFLLAIINVFNPNGWGGNVSFGQPDLWIAGRAELNTPTPAPGSEVTYNYTITNKGDAPATDVTLRSFFDRGLIAFEEPPVTLASLGKSELPPNERVWSLGTISPGESIQNTFKGIVSDILPNGETIINNRTTVGSNENDGNSEDNTDTVTLAVYGGSNVGGASGGGKRESPNPARTAPPDYVITKTVSSTEVEPGGSIDFEINIKNYSFSPGYKSVLIDKLIGPGGEVINEQAWDLDQIYPQEEIIVGYTIEFTEDSFPGVYTNDAYIEGLAGHKKEEFGYPIISESGAAQFTILGDPPVEIVEEEEEKELLVEEETEEEVVPVVIAQVDQSNSPPPGAAVVEPEPEKIIAPVAPAQAALAYSAVPFGLSASILFLIATAFILILWWRSELATKHAGNGGNGGSGPSTAYADPFHDTIELHEIGDEMIKALKEIGAFIKHGLSSTLPFLRRIGSILYNILIVLKEHWVFGITMLGFYLIKILTGHEVNRNLSRPKLRPIMDIGDGAGRAHVIQKREVVQERIAKSVSTVSRGKVIKQFADRSLETSKEYARTALEFIGRVLLNALGASQKALAITGKSIKHYWTLGVTKAGFYIIKGLTGHEIEIKKARNIDKARE